MVNNLERLKRLGFHVVEIEQSHFDQIEESHFDYLLDVTREIVSIDKHAAKLINFIISLRGQNTLNDIRLEKFIDTYISVENADYKILADWIKDIQSEISDEEAFYRILDAVKRDFSIFQRYMLAEQLLMEDESFTLVNKFHIFRRPNSSKIKIRSFKHGQFKFDIEKDRFIRIVEKVFGLDYLM